MANITTYLDPATRCKSIDVGNFTITKSQVLPAAGIANADVVQYVTIPHAMRLIGLVQAVAATLGAGATVQARLNRSGVFTALCAASTAAAASVNQMTAAPMDLAAGDIIELLVAGAGVTAAAAVSLDIFAYRK